MRNVIRTKAGAVVASVIVAGSAGVGIWQAAINGWGFGSVIVSAASSCVSSCSGTVTLSAIAPPTATSVAFEVDGRTVATDHAAPWTASWDTTTAANGSHTVTAFAANSAGSAVSAGVSVGVSNASSGLTANVWVDAAGSDVGSNCTWSASATTEPTASTVCASFNKALQLAPSGGGTVGVGCGTYDQQILNKNASLTAPVTFQPKTIDCATIQKSSSSLGTGPSLSFGSGTSWVTIQDFVINGLQQTCATLGSCKYGFSAIADQSGNGSSSATHISILNNELDMGVQLGGGSIINLHTPQNWLISGNTFGPACCGFAADNSPVGVTIGKPQTGTNSCSTEACNVDITRNIFQYANLRHATDWPSSGWGSAPEPTCTDAVLCHLDGLHIGGLIGGNLSYNQFLGTDCEGIYLESGGFQGNDNENINMIGNTWTAFSDHCNGGIYLKCTGSANGCGGTFNIGFNSGNDQMTLGVGWAGAETGTVVNLYGNYSRLLMANSSGSNGGCMAGTSGNVTINYQYNAWMTPSGGGTSGPCGGTDSGGASTPGWIDALGAPNVGLDMHLASTSGTAIDFVPCSSLTIGLGCPSGADTFGNTWPTVNANAGADQTGA